MTLRIAYRFIKYLLITLSAIYSTVLYGQQTAETSLRQGNEHYRAGRYDLAIESFTESIRLNPELAQAHNNRGFTLVTKGEYDKALSDFSEAIRINPRFVNAYDNRCFIWHYKGELHRAFTDCSEAIRINPQYANSYRNRCSILTQLGDFDRAIVDCTEAIRLRPDFADAYQNRGAAWARKANYDKSLSDFNEAIRINPSVVNGLSNRCDLFLRVGEYDKAIVDCSEAIRINPQHANAYATRGNAWHSKGDSVRAIADYSEAIRINPQMAIAYSNRAFVWHLKGEYDQAIADLNQAIRIDPSNADAGSRLQLAQDAKNRIKEPAVQVISEEKRVDRVALVIGISEYTSASSLPNAKRDAELFSKTLKDVGFNELVVVINPSKNKLIEELNKFERLARYANQAVLYFAGHGIEVNGVNYMIPSDVAQLEENRLSEKTVDMEYLLNSVEVAKQLRLVIIDACRDNPFLIKPAAGSRSRSMGELSGTKGKGLARIEPQPGTLVVYSTKHGQVALDGDGSSNSPFTESLVKRILQKPPIEIRRLFDFVREDVFYSTKKVQQPFAYGSLSAKEDFFFVKQ